jgi:hypothetical protein
MALITTVGGANSDSYVTTNEADTYLDDLGYSITDWEALDDEPKEFRLKMGALLINTLPLRGAKACRSQRLEFPRWWRTDDGYPTYEDTYIEYSEIAAASYIAPTIPQEVKDAQIQFTYQVVHNGIMIMDAMSFPEREIKAFGLGGSLTIEFTDQVAKNYAMYTKGRLSSLDPAFFLLHKWLRKLSGAVV